MVSVRAEFGKILANDMWLATDRLDISVSFMLNFLGTIYCISSVKSVRR